MSDLPCFDDSKGIEAGARGLLPSVLLVCFSWRAGVGVR